MDCPPLSQGFLFILIIYIMITKFRCVDDFTRSLEVENLGEKICFSIDEIDSSEYLEVNISKEDLFNLIGHLLRVQSEIRKEGSV